MNPGWERTGESWKLSGSRPGHRLLLLLEMLARGVHRCCISGFVAPTLSLGKELPSDL